MMVVLEVSRAEIYEKFTREGTKNAKILIITHTSNNNHEINNFQEH